MKLWLLRPIETEGPNLWDPWYDKAFGFVVRAKNGKGGASVGGEESRRRKNARLAQRGVDHMR